MKTTPKKTRTPAKKTAPKAKLAIQIIDLPNELFIENRKVFNCGIVDYQGLTYMFYRYELPYGDYNTELGVCELGTDYYPKEHTNQKLDIIRHTSKITTFDDPRPFVFRQELYFIFAHGMVVPYTTYNGWCCSLGIGKISDNKRIIPVIPQYGQNVNASNKGRSSHYAQEKNWSPLIHRNNVYFVYNINPLTIVECDIASGACREAGGKIEYDLSFWKHGSFLGGGTPFVEYQGKYYSFFHTFTLEDAKVPSLRRYHAGLICINQDLKIESISAEPLISAEMNAAQDLRPPSSWWRPNVVFPCGLVMRKIDGKDYFCMSYGWQDCRCKIAMIPVDGACSTLVKVKAKV